MIRKTFLSQLTKFKLFTILRKIRKNVIELLERQKVGNAPLPLLFVPLITVMKNNWGGPYYGKAVGMSPSDFFYIFSCKSCKSIC